MGFQAAGIRVNQAGALPGEIQRHFPSRSAPYRLASGAAVNNVFGRAFWHLPASPGEVAAENVAETLAFAGILAIPKDQTLIGVGGAGTALDPSFELPNDTQAEFVTMGFIAAVILNGAAAVGDPLFVVEITGQITTLDDLTTIPLPNGVIAPFIEAATGAAGEIGIIQLTN